MPILISTTQSKKIGKILIEPFYTFLRWWNDYMKIAWLFVEDFFGRETQSLRPALIQNVFSQD